MADERKEVLGGGTPLGAVLIGVVAEVLSGIGAAGDAQAVIEKRREGKYCQT